MVRQDPYRGFRFVVEIDRIESGGFSEVSGINRETVTEDYRAGGENQFVHRLVTHTKYPNLVLKRGITDAQTLWDWHQRVIDGFVERNQVTVILTDEADNEAWRWVFEGAYPVKWSGGELNAGSNTVVVEAVEFAHHGFRRQRP